MNKPEVPIGIDLGTTFSAISHVDENGRPVTIPNSEGELITPSVVFFDRDGVIVGTEAAHEGEFETERLAKTAKRDMGDARYRKKVLGHFLPPEVIQSYVLRRLKSDAELKIGEFTKAVVTVPAYFNEPRRLSTQAAGELAGIDVIDIINEPTAAALAFGVQHGFLSDKGEAKQKERVLVYDLGGGTFDATLMEIKGTQFNAIGTTGDVYLGGIDWDKRVFDFAKDKIQSEHDVKVEEDPSLSEKVMNQCIRAKKTLTARTEAAIRVEHEGQRFKVQIGRDQFEDMTQDLLERTKLTTDRLLREAKLKWSDLTRLLLVGGSTRMPMVGDMLEKASGLKVDRSLSPDESVAHGAAIFAGILMKHGSTAGKGISVSNVNSHDLGVMGVDPKTRKTRRRIVIPKNHRLPAKTSRKFQTSKDGQKNIAVQVVEGGTDDGQGSTTIGKCVVSDLPADIKKGTEVVVTFNYLNSGRLSVVAQIPSLKLKADTTVERASGLSRNELLDWKEKIENGLGYLDEPPVESDNESPEVAIVADQPDKQKIPQAITKKPAPKKSPEKKSPQPDQADQEMVKIDLGDEGKSSKSTSEQVQIDVGDEGKQSSKTSEKVQIDLGDEKKVQKAVTIEDSDAFAFGDAPKKVSDSASGFFINLDD